MAPTKISVIIPTINAYQLLETLVAALRDQSVPPYQILVVDSGSAVQTAAIAQCLNVELLNIKPGSFDHGATRNFGAKHAAGDILVFMTQDALPQNREMIEKLIKPLRYRDVVVSYARQIPDEKASPAEHFLRLANYPPGSKSKSMRDIDNMGIKTFQNSNVCAAYRRIEFDSLGRFPTPVVCNEDMLFAAKAIFAGYKVAYSADALVLHTHHLGPVQLFRRYFDIATSLDHEPRIKALGRTEEKGLEFFRNQVKYLGDQNKLKYLPCTLLETAAKYFGFKTGANHNLIPTGLKKYLGSNTLYWSRLKKQGSENISRH